MRMNLWQRTLKMDCMLPTKRGIYLYGKVMYVFVYDDRGGVRKVAGGGDWLGIRERFLLLFFFFSFFVGKQTIELNGVKSVTLCNLVRRCLALFRMIALFLISADSLDSSMLFTLPMQH